MKQYIEKFYSKTSEPVYLENLTEKSQDIYIDAEVKHVTKLVNAIAEDAIKSREHLKFTLADEPGVHYFIPLSNKLAKRAGLKSIQICPYCGNIHPESDTIESNYILDGGVLYIDIYDCFFFSNCVEHRVKQKVIQELTNLIRDVKWVNDGIYEEKMAEMKSKVENNKNKNK